MPKFAWWERARPSALAEREAAWYEAVGGPRTAVPETVEAIQRVLEGQLDRARDGIKAHDDKAALVIPGVGAIATIIGTNVSSTAIASIHMKALLGLTFVFAAGSVVLALVCLAPIWERANGPLPKPLVLGTGDDVLLAKVRIVNALGFAVESAEVVANAKAFWVAASLRVGAAAVGLLLLFVMFGGLA